ncbi:DegT/DnrJ/EryC1/StrS family aminotransferase [Endozoicomonas sp. 8E]|uniref:DegT/DnrJ/EryC1/StrS family aminotransferase n=1 Tax=Endozoicomonas sp. 8E TaxID=3035692 RepID=UPI002938D4C9|nr:DegT/DnrJ/EryC1/StrS family aminotransferase [Endozoicomonas sp. 8E]WOG26339.1 DegT/DnrJ/EryC1/StrS family aminotransferase [Endozoicomonas sp. 8E]
MAIQLFVPHFRINECLEEIRECLEKGWTGLGFKTIEMENKWKEYTGLPHAHFLSSNTVGLHLALHMFKTEFGWVDGDEVISTPLTFVSTNHAIVYTNLLPVFADIDESLCLSPENIEQKITSRTRAVIFVGIGGNTGRYPEVVKLCKDRGLMLILDAAHMAGTRLNGKHVGHDADCTVFSFQAVKNLATADSGMICFPDQARDERVRKLTWLGINKDTYSRTYTQSSYKWMYDVDEIGFKYHGNSIMAAIGLVSLRYLDRDNAYRRQLVKWYQNCLANNELIRIVPIANECESSCHLFQIRVSNRDEILMALNEYEISPGVHYRDNTEYRLYNQAAGTCPKAHLASKEILSLPMHMSITERDVQTIADALKEVIKSKAG